jgi:hypothetical protein
MNDSEPDSQHGFLNQQLSNTKTPLTIRPKTYVKSRTPIKIAQHAHAPAPSTRYVVEPDDCPSPPKKAMTNPTSAVDVPRDFASSQDTASAAAGGKLANIEQPTQSDEAEPESPPQCANTEDSSPPPSPPQFDELDSPPRPYSPSERRNQQPCGHDMHPRSEVFTTVHVVPNADYSIAGGL